MMWSYCKHCFIYSAIFLNIAVVLSSKTAEPVSGNSSYFKYKQSLRPADSSFSVQLSSNGWRKIDTSIQSANVYKRVCYLTLGLSVKADIINPFLCTHILIFNGFIANSSVIYVEKNLLPQIGQVNNLKNINHDLLVSLSVRGSSRTFGPAVSSAEKRLKLAKSMRKFVCLHGLDGIDLDWEFPAYLTNFQERHNFTLLLVAIRQQLKCNNEEKVISIAVAAPSVIVDLSYEVEPISRLVDFVSVMCYDFHMYSDVTPFTGHNAPLFQIETKFDYLKNLNTNYSVNYWLRKGMPRHKLVVGLPTYARGYELINQYQHSLFALARNFQEGRILGLNEVCFYMKRGGKEVWDTFALVSYAYREKLWLSYASLRSIEAKSVYTRTMGLAGVMTFQLNEDDPFNECGFGGFPLHNRIKSILT